MQEILNIFLDDIKNNKEYTENTCLAYKKDISEFILFLTAKDIRIENITLTEYLDFTDTLKLKKISKSTYARKISAIKKFADYLNKNYNLPEFKQKIKIASDLPIVSSKTVKKINLAEIHSLNPSQFRDHIIIHLLKISKISVGQLANLEIKDFNLITGFLNLNNKIIKLDSELLILLKQYLRSRDHDTKYLLAVNFQGTTKPLSKQAIWAILRTNLSSNKKISLDKLNPTQRTKSIFDIDSTKNIQMYKRTHPRENNF